MHIVPATVFSGFLGSGKTTIISHLIADLQSSGIQVVYIKNEIGDENIDGQIMRGQNIATKELLNGCICCTLVGPFIQAIDEIIEKFKPDRLIIEASGAADPSAIALMIQSHPKLERDGIISIIDVANFEGYKDLSQTAQNQTKFTDLLVFNKVELVDLDRTRAVVGYVRELNTHSPIVEAPQGKLNPEVAFGLSTNQLADLLISAEGVAHREHHEQHSHLQEDGITTFHIPTPGTCTLPDLEKFLTGLPGAIYRVKGFVQLSDGTTVVANKVGNRISFVPAPESTKITEGALVFIGFSIAELEGKIATQLASVFKK